MELGSNGAYLFLLLPTGEFHGRSSDDLNFPGLLGLLIDGDLFDF